MKFTVYDLHVWFVRLKARFDNWDWLWELIARFDFPLWLCALICVTVKCHWFERLIRATVKYVWEWALICTFESDVWEWRLIWAFDNWDWLRWLLSAIEARFDLHVWGTRAGGVPLSRLIRRLIRLSIWLWDRRVTPYDLPLYMLQTVTLYVLWYSVWFTIEFSLIVPWKFARLPIGRIAF